MCVRATARLDLGPGFCPGMTCALHAHHGIADEPQTPSTACARWRGGSHVPARTLVQEDSCIQLPLILSVPFVPAAVAGVAQSTRPWRRPGPHAPRADVSQSQTITT